MLVAEVKPISGVQKTATQQRFHCRSYNPGVLALAATAAAAAAAATGRWDVRMPSGAPGTGAVPCGSSLAGAWCAAACCPAAGSPLAPATQSPPYSQAVTLHHQPGPRSEPHRHKSSRQGQTRRRRTPTGSAAGKCAKIITFFPTFQSSRRQERSARGGMHTGGSITGKQHSYQRMRASNERLESAWRAWPPLATAGTFDRELHSPRTRFPTTVHGSFCHRCIALPRSVIEAKGRLKTCPAPRK